MGKQPVPFFVEMPKSLMLSLAIFFLLGTGILAVILLANQRPSAPATKSAARTKVKSLDLEYVRNKVERLNALNRKISEAKARINSYTIDQGGNFAEERSRWESALKSLEQTLQRETESLPLSFFAEVKKLGLKIIADP